jgi:hypothetical protein
LAQKAGKVWSKDKQAAPIRKAAPEKSNQYVDELAKQAMMAKRAGNYNKAAVQEWWARNLAESEAQ